MGSTLNIYNFNVAKKIIVDVYIPQEKGNCSACSVQQILEFGCFFLRIYDFRLMLEIVSR